MMAGDQIPETTISFLKRYFLFDVARIFNNLKGLPLAILLLHFKLILLARRTISNALSFMNLEFAMKHRDAIFSNICFALPIKKVSLDKSYHRCYKGP